MLTMLLLSSIDATQVEVPALTHTAPTPPVFVLFPSAERALKSQACQPVHVKAVLGRCACYGVVGPRHSCVSASDPARAPAHLDLTRGRLYELLPLGVSMAS